MGSMDSLPGGYTNATRRSPNGQVEKRYRGDDRYERAAIERTCLEGLAELLPVPTVVAVDPDEPTLTMVDVRGRHGQELVDAGDAAVVLRLAGELLRSLQELAPAMIPELPGSGDVIVHGDFGPQNLLVDGGRVSALLDWELAHRGDPIEDLAWAEWIVRMHHRHAIDALDELHRGAALDVNWPARHAAMARRCDELVRYCERHRTDGTELWRTRLRLTEAWTE
jgi:aminoglycoside phosphotransferase (APT) family kinase protein